jgi:hypothetical protein
MTKTFTVMCQEASGYGTIWIDYITVSLDSAGNYPLATIQDLATKKCSEEWGRDWETDHSILCMGVIEGSVNFLYFDDSHLE